MWRKILTLTGVSAGALTMSASAPANPPVVPPFVFQLLLPLSSIPDEAAVVNKFDADLETRFAFARTVGQVLSSAGIPNTAAAREQLVQTMMSSFNANNQTNPVSGLSMPTDIRPNEGNLSPAQMLDPAAANGLIPIGLFNRLDLAPADWSDCGEHRIVYATKANAPAARFFIIF